MLKEAKKTAAVSNKDWLIGHLPNALTLFRVFLVPFFVILLIEPTSASRFGALLVFLLASVTDWLDGYIARAYDAQSILGTILDPIADKILVIAALVMLATDPSGQTIPGWIVVLLLSREVLVTGLRSVAAVQGALVPASNLAKYKTAATMVAILLLLVGDDFLLFSYSLDLFSFGYFMLWVALVLSVWSGAQYASSLKKAVVEAAFNKPE